MTQQSSLDRYLEELPDTESDLLRKVLADPTVENVELAELLSSHGYSISESAVRRWRAKQ